VKCGPGRSGVSESRAPVSSWSVYRTRHFPSSLCWIAILVPKRASALVRTTWRNPLLFLRLRPDCQHTLPSDKSASLVSEHKFDDFAALYRLSLLG